MARSVVVMVTYPASDAAGVAVGELDASHLWPFVPRVGDTIQWVDGDTEWAQVVDQVNVHLDPAAADADVWVGTMGTASQVDET